MIKRLRWSYGIALLCLVAAYYLQDPHLLPVRLWLGPGIFLLAMTGLALSLWHWPQQRWRMTLHAALWLGIVGMVLYQVSAPYRHRQAVMAAYAHDPLLLTALGEHLVVGYDDPAQVRELASKGLIGGVFIAQRNVAGKSFEALRDEIHLLQRARQLAGLPPLLIAADQEGGPVSRLSPPLPPQPGLATLIEPGLPDQAIAQRVAQYAGNQAQALAALGINTNFSPVVDLKLRQIPRWFDTHTRIAERAIAGDPQQVALVAQVYSRALLAHGVVPTLKHFPGLGRVRGDTHHFTAHLRASQETLQASDWLPFQQVLRQTPAMLMVGHVTLDALDKSRPASVSRPVLAGLLRSQWEFEGVLISDDLSMAPTYGRGLCRSAVEALNASMDLLLLTYDHEKTYELLDCLQRALRSGKLERTQLVQSEWRLTTLPWRRNGV